MLPKKPRVSLQEGAIGDHCHPADSFACPSWTPEAEGPARHSSRQSQGPWKTMDEDVFPERSTRAARQSDQGIDSAPGQRLFRRVYKPVRPCVCYVSSTGRCFLIEVRLLLHY